jgi:thioesterase domain-containing protein/aryl carrier-like protein
MATLDVRAVNARCADDRAVAPEDQRLASSQAGQLGFGPRWSVLQTVGFGKQEAVAELALLPTFVRDLEEQPLHPGLLDIATGFALPLVQPGDAASTLYVPLTYGRVRVFGALTQVVVSHVVSRPGNRPGGETVTFDVSIADPSGRVLIAAEGYQMRRLDPAAGFASARASRSGRSQPRHDPTPAERVFLETFAAGLRVAEGFGALERTLRSPQGGAVVVSPIEVEPWRARLERACRSELEAPGVKFSRPELDSAYEGPRDALETQLASFWEELLGVDRIGIHDDFFELGGHSLIAVRLFARIRKEWGVDWPISVLFDAPTIAKCGDLLRAEVGTVEAGGESASATESPRGPALRFLVAMNKVSGTHKRPLFLVAGMFGNVLNLRHLASHLGADQPVYALQAKGLYGDDTPHRRFEDMATDYLREIRTVQPQGPYLIGGFSGGGVTAFEMAHQLRAAGEAVAGIVMLDAIPPPPAWPQPTQADYLRIHSQRLLREGPRYLTDRVRNRIRWEQEKRERRANPVPNDLTPAEFRSEQIEIAFREALAHYTMRPYAGPIHLFRPPLDNAHPLSGGRMANSKREQLVASLGRFGRRARGTGRSRQHGSRTERAGPGGPPQGGARAYPDCVDRDIRRGIGTWFPVGRGRVN